MLLAFAPPAPAHTPPVASILPAPGVEYLRCRTSASGYRNVYEHGTDGHGLVRYVAKVKMGGRLRSLPDGRSTMPHVSAAAVVRWYERRFGANWKAALKRRKCNPVKVWHSKSRGGFLAAVWLWGVRQEVRPVDRDGRVRPNAPVRVFTSREAAHRGVRAFAAEQWGLLGSAAMWRA